MTIFLLITGNIIGSSSIFQEKMASKVKVCYAYQNSSKERVWCIEANSSIIYLSKFTFKKILWQRVYLANILCMNWPNFYLARILHYRVHTYVQVVKHKIRDELCELESKVMVHKINAERLQNSMKLLEKNLEEFTLEMMV